MVGIGNAPSVLLTGLLLQSSVTSALRWKQPRSAPFLNVVSRPLEPEDVGLPNESETLEHSLPASLAKLDKRSPA